jgi:hypothetical protein
MKDIGAFVGLFVGSVCVIILISFLFSYFTMLLWNNCLVPAVDGVHTVSWLQAWGITLLFSILCKTRTYRSKENIENV